MAIQKTPVTILNEMMSKIQGTVIYELSDNDVNIKSGLFTFKVTCDGFTALGSGRSKKEAKQNAASAILKKIDKQNVTTQSMTNKSLQLSNVSVLDMKVQELEKLCSKYQFSEPVFNDLDTTGPSHARMFNMQCTVYPLTSIGVGKTKKQAKIDAANEMITQIKDIFCVNKLLDKDSTKKMKITDESRNFDNIISKSIEKKSTWESALLKINCDVQTSSQNELMKSLKDLVITLSSKLEYLQNLAKECQRNNYNEKEVNQVKQEFQNIFESVNIDFHHMLLQTADPTTYMLIIQLNTTPSILEMSLGATREEAELRTIDKIIENLRSRS